MITNGTIINLTQHAATPDQIAAGVIDLPEEYRRQLVKALTFDTLPDQSEINARAKAIGDILYQFLMDELYEADGETDPMELLLERVAGLDLRAMIGGAPWLMATLEESVRDCECTPVYAFSRRIVEEVPQSDGSVVKRAVFRHEGFVIAA